MRATDKRFGKGSLVPAPKGGANEASIGFLPVARNGGLQRLRICAERGCTRLTGRCRTVKNGSIEATLVAMITRALLHTVQSFTGRAGS